MEPENKSNKTLIWIIVAIIVIIVGWYLWSNNKPMEGDDTVPTTVEETTSELNTLEQDLNNTDTNLNLDLDNLN